ncbi:MAG: hypothetical protein B7733_15010 [Myxococcales bacterium FL481]|nr:MAG: hypothetical protein B7733_15010 [Myxococcales bacterium FL481]
MSRQSLLVVLLTSGGAACVLPCPPLAVETSEATGAISADPLFSERDPSQCLVPDSSRCEGHPLAEQYGYAPGDTLPNVLLYDCDGTPREIAEFFGTRPDLEDYNRAVVVAFGALW